jgi:hypothetical protein
MLSLPAHTRAMQAEHAFKHTHHEPPYRTIPNIPHLGIPLPALACGLERLPCRWRAACATIMYLLVWPCMQPRTHQSSCMYTREHRLASVSSPRQMAYTNCFVSHYARVAVHQVSTYAQCPQPRTNFRNLQTYALCSYPVAHLLSITTQVNRPMMITSCTVRVCLSALR